MKIATDEDCSSDSGYTSSLPQHVGKSADGHAPKAHQLLLANVPFAQKAVLTPKVGPKLNLQVSNIAVREPKPGEAVVCVAYTGICRSDASFSVGAEAGFPKCHYIAGHEGIGRVVKAHDMLLLGRPVAIRYVGSSCMSCTYCLRELFTSCPDQINVPRQVSGTFQQYITIPISCLVPLPDDVFSWKSIPSYTAALCSGSTALTTLRSASTRAGHVVVVVGIPGAIGHLIGAIAKQVLGAKVIGVDLGWKINSLLVGFDHFGDAFLPASDGTEEGWSSFKTAMLRATAHLRKGDGLSRGADAVLVSSSTASAFTKLNEYVCDGGSIVCVGVPKDVCPVTVPVRDLVERNLHLTGNLMGGHDEALTVMQYIRSGRVKPHITEVSLDDIPEQMQRLIDCKTFGKVVVRVNGLDLPLGDAEAIVPQA